MLKTLIACTLFALITAVAPSDAATDCAKPTLESRRLLCQANAIKARCVQTVVVALSLGPCLAI